MVVARLLISCLLFLTLLSAATAVLPVGVTPDTVFTNIHCNSTSDWDCSNPDDPACREYCGQQLNSVSSEHGYWNFAHSDVYSGTSSDDAMYWVAGNTNDGVCRYAVRCMEDNSRGYEQYCTYEKDDAKKCSVSECTPPEPPWGTCDVDNPTSPCSYADNYGGWNNRCFEGPTAMCTFDATDPDHRHWPNVDCVDSDFPICDNELADGTSLGNYYCVAPECDGIEDCAGDCSNYGVHVYDLCVDEDEYLLSVSNPSQRALDCDYAWDGIGASIYYRDPQSTTHYLYHFDSHYPNRKRCLGFGTNYDCWPDVECAAYGPGNPGECGSNGCEDCGSCPDGYTCSDNTCVSVGCTPDCSGLECGPDPVCGESCGDCDGNPGYCNSGTCDFPDPVCRGYGDDTDGDGWVEIICDNFNDGSLDLGLWNRVLNDGTITESGDYVEFSATPPSGSYPYLEPLTAIPKSNKLRMKTVARFADFSQWGAGLFLRDACTGLNYPKLGQVWGGSGHVRYDTGDQGSSATYQYVDLEASNPHYYVFEQEGLDFSMDSSGGPAFSMTAAACDPATTPYLFLGNHNDPPGSGDFADPSFDYVLVECYAEEEVCDDGWDNDCDGLIDDDDSDCAGGEDDCDDVGNCCTNGVDDDGDGWVDAEDGDCAPVTLTLDPTVTLDLRPLMTASFSSASSIPVGAGHPKYVCDFQGCNETDGTCLNKNPLGGRSAQEYFCTTTDTRCTFQDSTIERSGDYQYTLCIGENTGDDWVAINAPHCSHNPVHSEGDDVW